MLEWQAVINFYSTILKSKGLNSCCQWVISSLFPAVVVRQQFVSILHTYMRGSCLLSTVTCTLKVVTSWVVSGPSDIILVIRWVILQLSKYSRILCGHNAVLFEPSTLPLNCDFWFKGWAVGISLTFLPTVWLESPYSIALVFQAQLINKFVCPCK